MHAPGSNIDFLLKSIFIRGFCGSLHLVLLLALSVAYVCKKLSRKGDREGSKEMLNIKRRFMWYKRTLVCCLGVSVFNFILCLLSYFYLYGNVWSDGEAMTLLDLGLRTLSWGALAVYLHTQFFNSDVFLHHKHVSLEIEWYLVSDVVSVFTGLFLCYVGFLRSDIQDVLEEPLLNGDSSSINNLENRGADTVTPFGNAGLFSSYVGPYLIDVFVQCLDGRGEFKNQGYILASAFVVAKLVECLAQKHLRFRLQQIGTRLRAVTATMIYNKSLTISCHSKQGHSSGQIINIMTIDANRLGIFSWYMHDPWLVILQVCLALLILYRNLGLGSVAGFVATVIVMSLNYPFGRLEEKFQDKLMESKDKRMKATTEILRNIRILKLQGWEMKFLSKILELRKVETRWLKKYLYTSVVITVVAWVTPTVVAVATFGTCMLMGVPLDSGKVLSALATFEILQSPIYNLPSTVSMLIQTKVSLDRISSFLCLDDLQPDAIEKLPVGSSDKAIEIVDGNFSWDLSSPCATLKDINFKVLNGLKVAVCGTVGSGKSSLLSSILGELPKISGTLKLCGTKAYVAQSPWILSGLAVTYALGLYMAQFVLIWCFCNCENKLISVEIILQYISIPAEPPLVIEANRPDHSWPSQGEVDIDNLQVRYAPHMPLVLRGLSCTFPGGKKTGIVGRTGSGKSTLIQALFRTVEPAACQIMIDSIDISLIGLHDLRSRLSIIPQDPTMFEGTVRSNLDPLEEYTDEQIWEVLDKCQLGDEVRKKERKLDSTEKGIFFGYDEIIAAIHVISVSIVWRMETLISHKNSEGLVPCLHDLLHSDEQSCSSCKEEQKFSGSLPCPDDLLHSNKQSDSNGRDRHKSTGSASWLDNLLNSDEQSCSSKKDQRKHSGSAPCLDDLLHSGRRSCRGSRDPQKSSGPQKRLEQLLSQSGNKICADCGSPDPKWVSISFGVFICIKCSGVHRSLGVHLTKVLSIKLDEWTDEQVNTLIDLGGNTAANKKYEAFIPDDYQKPKSDASIEERSDFIRRKYEQKQFSNCDGHMSCPFPGPRSTLSSSCSSHCSPQDKKQYEKQATRHRIGNAFRNSWGRKDTEYKNNKKSNSLAAMVEFVGLIKVNVVKGTNLAVRDVLTSDPYVVLTLGQQSVRTRVIKNNLNPIWNESLMLSIPEQIPPLKVLVYDKDKFTTDDFMGKSEEIRRLENQMTGQETNRFHGFIGLQEGNSNLEKKMEQLE
ncbi:hypothetical protein D5086_007552 [Populus alba]|uniref:Uncharacterized protein n=1 Tax=Populus alba TaxID=43335 RepID=A0ACC4CQ07_POPAL